MGVEEDFNYEDLSPGIQDAVRWLHSCGWDTIDSGDGSLAKAGMECAYDEPMVAIAVPRMALVHLADRLKLDLESFVINPLGAIEIQAMYNPLDGHAIILLTGEGLLNIEPAPEVAR